MIDILHYFLRHYIIEFDIINHPQMISMHVVAKALVSESSHFLRIKKIFGKASAYPLQKPLAACDMKINVIVPSNWNSVPNDNHVVIHQLEIIGDPV
jgi:hypothetical protein